MRNVVNNSNRMWNFMCVSTEIPINVCMKRDECKLSTFIEVWISRRLWEHAWNLIGQSNLLIFLCKRLWLQWNVDVQWEKRICTSAKLVIVYISRLSWKTMAWIDISALKISCKHKRFNEISLLLEFTFTSHVNATFRVSNICVYSATEWNEMKLGPEYEVTIILILWLSKTLGYADITDMVV